MAGSIKVFQFVQKYSRAIGIDPHESNKIDFKINWKKICFFVSEAQFIASLTAFMLYEANSIFEYGTTFFAISSSMFATFVHLAYSWQMKNISKFTENCEQFIEKRERSAIAYEKLNKKIEMFCKLFCITFLSSPLLMTGSIFLFTIVNYYIFDLDAESFYLIFQIVLPFDWKTPFGYAMAWLLQFVGGAATFSTGVPFISLFAGSCWLFVFVADDITNDVAAFNSGKITKRNQVATTKRFCAIVQIYTHAKQCVNNFNAIYEYSLFAFVVWALISVCCMLLTIEFQLLDDNSKPIEIAIQSLFILLVSGNLFLLFEAGERVSNKFEIFGDEFERCNWYKLSIKIQRLYGIFLLDTQQSVNIECYGGIQYTRETLKKIITKGYSYFTALRQI